MAGTTTSDYLDPLAWGTTSGGSAGAAETTSTLGTDRLDVKVPSDQYHSSHLQLARMRNLLQSMSQYYKGGTRLQVLSQTANPFGSTEVGYYADNATTPNPRFSANGTLTYLANAAVTAKGDMAIFNGTNWAKLAVGTDTQVLTADSTQATGIKWAAGGSGGTLTTAYVAGSSASDQTLLIQSGDGGPVIFKANGAATGSLVKAQTSGAVGLFNITDNAAQ